MKLVAPVIEIIDRNKPGDTLASTVCVPSDVRINGVSLLVEDESVTVHEIDLKNLDLVRVTMTFLARRVSIGFADEITSPPAAAGGQ